MGKLEFERIREIGILSQYDNSLQFNLMNWGGYEKYDIRRWSEDGEQPYKGITINEDELPALLELLQEAVDSEKSMHPEHTISTGKATAKILDTFGVFGSSGSWDKEVCYVDWGHGAKYDLRAWSSDYSSCGKGVTLSEDECLCLLELLSDELGIDEEPSIAFEDFVIRANSFYCLKNHRTETITAQVNLLKRDGSIETAAVTAGYCSTCKCYFLPETEYQNLRRQGILLCQVLTEKVFRTNGTAIIEGWDLKPESLLHQCGYNVNATDDLSDEQRQSVLIYVVESGLQSVYDICSFLDWLIARNEQRIDKDMSSAVAKWRFDRKFISDYKKGSRRLVGIHSLSAKERM